MVVSRDTLSFILNVLFYLSYSTNAVPQKKHFTLWIPVPKALGLVSSKSVRVVWLRGHLTSADQVGPESTSATHYSTWPPWQVPPHSLSSPFPPFTLPLCSCQDLHGLSPPCSSSSEKAPRLPTIHGMKSSFLGLRSFLCSTPPSQEPEVQ